MPLHNTPDIREIVEYSTTQCQVTQHPPASCPSPKKQEKMDQTTLIAGAGALAAVGVVAYMVGMRRSSVCVKRLAYARRPLCLCSSRSSLAARASRSTWYLKPKVWRRAK